jgi:hypothetical protein
MGTDRRASRKSTSTGFYKVRLDRLRTQGGDALTLYLFLDEGRQREVIEQIREVFPDVAISVLSETLVIKTISAKQ